MKLADLLEQADGLEAELLNSPSLEAPAVDAAIVALNAGGHLRLVVDLHPLGETRLRVRVIERGCAWWLSDSWGRAAPVAHASGTGGAPASRAAPQYQTIDDRRSAGA